jgi:hypothetical protein
MMWRPSVARLPRHLRPMNFFTSSAPSDPRKSIFEFTVKNNDGTPIPLETFRGKSPILVVNVASQ